jgi:hypothetical protein
MIILPSKVVVCVTQTAEIRSRNDHITVAFLVPTRAPEIRITGKPDYLDAEAEFGHGKLKKSHIPDRYEMDGVYFPAAHMRVRWWPKEEEAH